MIIVMFEFNHQIQGNQWEGDKINLGEPLHRFWNADKGKGIVDWGAPGLWEWTLLNSNRALVRKCLRQSW